VVDAASAELQGRPWHGRNDIVETPDKPRRWEQTGGALQIGCKPDQDKIAIVESWVHNDTTRGRKQSSVT